MNDATELRRMALNAERSIQHSELRGTKADGAKKYRVDGRDLRSVDLVCKVSPHVLVRTSVIFISMFLLRLLAVKISNHGEKQLSAIATVVSPKKPAN